MLLEQSTRGAVGWVRARPPEEGQHAPRFARFSEQRAAVVAHQTFLLERPSVPTGCQGCGAQDAWQQRNHLAACPCGIRASDTLHHPIRTLLAAMLREAYGSAVQEEPAIYWLFSELKRPDIVVMNANGPGRHLLIDVKTVDPTAQTHLTTNHSHQFALAAQSEAERNIRNEYTDNGARPNALDPNTELVCAAVGRYGGLGQHLLRLVDRCARRS